MSCGFLPQGFASWFLVTWKLPNVRCPPGPIHPAKWLTSWELGLHLSNANLEDTNDLATPCNSTSTLGCFYSGSQWHHLLDIWHDLGRPGAQSNSHRTSFLPGRSRGAPRPLIKFSSADENHLLSLQRRKSYRIPPPVSFIWKWSRYSTFFERFWLQYLESQLFQLLTSICLTCLFPQHQVLFASFRLCTKCTGPPISAGGKAEGGSVH